MIDSYHEDDEFVNEDVVIYDGEPDFDRSEEAEEGIQDDEGMGGFSSLDLAPGVKTWRETLEWYRENQTTRDIGFNPDGMCLKIVRTARGIPAMYASAVQAQKATPRKHRVYKVADLRKGMVGYFDDPNDRNRFGHIATLIGRVKGSDRGYLAATLWETNSVKSGELVVVRGNYFEQHWGDKFKFGATWLNGYELDYAGSDPKTKVEKFNSGGPIYNLRLLAAAENNGRKWAGEVLRRIEDQIRRLPDNPSFVNVREFKDKWRESRKIDMRLLDEAVAYRNNRDGLIKKVRDEILRLISTLPEE